MLVANFVLSQESDYGCRREAENFRFCLPGFDIGDAVSMLKNKFRSLYNINCRIDPTEIDSFDLYTYQ